MRAKQGGFLFSCFPALALIFIIFPITPQPTSSAFFEPTPDWWEIAVDLKTNGEYKLEGGNSSYIGEYTFVIRWTGWLEEDDQDYLLYRFDCRLSDWEAQETALSLETPAILTTPDFKEKPSFDLKYILRNGSDLKLDFVVHGIVAPQNGAEDGFVVLFPSSEENRQHDFEVDYNSCIIKGSNSVSLNEAEIYAGPVAKNYSWTWRHQQWLLKQQRTVFIAQSHRAEVSLSIIPHYTRPK